MEIPEIENFENLLFDVIPQNKKIVRCEKSRLSAPGENFASLILGIKVTIQKKENEDLEEETIHSVAKLLPSNNFMKSFMNISHTVRNELAFYQTILPTLRKFQEQQGSNKSLQAFPKFHGGRLSLDQSNHTLDNNAVILLENLKEDGYFVIDNYAGFDLEVTKLILSKMAELHSTFLALKETQRDVFEDKLMPFFDQFKIFQLDENEGYMTSEIVINAIINTLQEDELCSLYMNKIQQTIETCVHNLGLPKNSPKFQEDVFASLIHSDLWVNNIMVKTYLSKIVDVKILDWQLYEYASVVKDILFFLCSSTQEVVFKNNFDDLFKFYHEELIANLKELKCDTDKFSFNAFQEEMKVVAGESAFFYSMVALPSIFASDGNVWDVNELNKERLLGQVQQISDFCKNRMWLIARKFIQKGWI